MNNIERAAAINKSVETSNSKVIPNLVREDYIQHTPNVPDGRAGLLGLLAKIEYGEIPAPKINTIRTFDDGDFVVSHHEVFWPKRKAMIEIFRFKDGLAAEHWSGIVDHPEKTANGNSLVDGYTVIEDKQETENNKQLVRSFVQTVLVEGNFDKLPDYYHPEIIQHNPYIDNTVQGLVDGIAELSKQGITLQLEKIHYVLGQGNFVLVLSEGKFGGKPTAFFDLFRVSKGKVVEHWDVIQEVPEKMAHDNGMFSLSLYKRLGGYDAIAGFVDLAFPRVAAHPELEKFFVGHSTESKYRQRQLIVDRLCSITGGPVVYIGKPLESVHKGLGITAEQWNIFMSIIKQATIEVNFAPAEREEFLGLFENQFKRVTVEQEIK